MSFDPPSDWPTQDWPSNVTPIQKGRLFNAEHQRRAFDELTAKFHDARARELREDSPHPPSSEELAAELLAMPAANSDQLETKLRFFALELAKEADFGQNPDFRLIPYFAAIQRDCIRLLRAQLRDEDEAR